MKISKLLLVTSPLLIAIGCAHTESRHAQENHETLYRPGFAAGSGSSSDSASHGPDAGGRLSGSSSSGSPSASQPTATAPQDTALLMQVRQTLIEDPSLAMVVPSIDIADNNGAITLSGNVASEEQKNSVEALVRETSGVVLVNNNLKVASSALSGADSDLSLSATSRNVDPSTVPGADSSLSELFRATSETNYLSPELSLTSRSNASTGVYSGVQSGSASNQVDSMSEQLSQTSQQDTTNNATVPLTATSRPRDQSGGVDVNVQGSSAVDRTLGQQISQELKADASLASAISQVRISVDNGRVTLQGTVKNDVQKHEIESAVQRATGVSSVDNQLRISASGSPALERIYHEPQSQ